MVAAAAAYVLSEASNKFESYKEIVNVAANHWNCDLPTLSYIKQLFILMQVAVSNLRLDPG